MTVRARTFVLLTVVLAVAAPARAAPGKNAAKQALVKAQQLAKGNGVKTGHELTPALSQLFAALPSLSGSDRAAAEAILARPDDSTADPSGTHKWKGPEAPTSPKCSAHFCVHFTLSGADGSSDTYAQTMANVFENEVYGCENGTGATACFGRPGLGWRLPASDGTAGNTNAACSAGTCIDVYIEDLYTNERVYGYTAIDQGQTRDPAVPHYGYLVMDKDYSRYGGVSAIANERVTAAHEYNHLLQDAYDYLEDPWMLEATAVYIEDKVYPDDNDYLNYVKHWVANTKQPLTTFSDTNLKAYGSAVWNHWLDYRFGANAVRAAWEDSLGAANFAPGAYGAAITAAGGGGFPDEFARFSVAVAEWDTPGSGFPDRYPDVPRDGLLPAGTTTVPFSLPHTTFALFDVPAPADSPRAIRLTATLPAGTAGAVALVGRVGADPNAGTVTTQLTQMPVGGTAAVNLDNPAQYGRITAVVVNSDATSSGFDQTAGDWIFTKDATAVTAGVSEPGPPAALTGAAGVVADHSASVGASIDPRLLDTAWRIEYGRTTAYGSNSTPQTLPAATLGSAPVTSSLHDLRASTVYHYRAVATNAAGSTLGADATFTTARDVTKPVVSVKVTRQRIRRVRTRGLAYSARCSERCVGTASVLLSRTMARRLGLPKLLGKARVDLAVLPTSKTLRVHVGRRANKRLAHASRSLGATLELRVADESGNAVKLRRRVRLT